MENLLFTSFMAVSETKGVPLYGPLTCLSEESSNRWDGQYFTDGQHVYYESKSFLYMARQSKRVFFL